MRLQSETADKMAWSKYALPPLELDGSSQLRAALARIEFMDVSTPTPLRAAIQQAAVLRARHKRLLIMAGRSRRLAAEDHHFELKQVCEEHRSSVSEHIRKTSGDVASAMLVSSSATALVVLQAAIPTE